MPLTYRISTLSFPLHSCRSRYNVSRIFLKRLFFASESDSSVAGTSALSPGVPRHMLTLAPSEVWGFSKRSHKHFWTLPRAPGRKNSGSSVYNTYCRDGPDIRQANLCRISGQKSRSGASLIKTKLSFSRLYETKTLLRLAKSFTFMYLLKKKSDFTC